MNLNPKVESLSNVHGADNLFNYSTDIIFGHLPFGRGLKNMSNTEGFTGMKRILVLGSSGSGKSTFSRHLGARLSLPVIHLDNYFWHPGWVGTPRAEWEQKVSELVAYPKWVIDGNYRGTLDIRLQAADTVIFLDIPRWLCTFRAIKRRIQNQNQIRTDMAPGCPERLFNHHTVRFLRRIWDYPNRARPEIKRKMATLPPNKLAFQLNSTRKVNHFLANVHTYSPIYTGYPLMSREALV